ncbi:hypothetical protein RclHR1_05800015 [Rhizophagus clarus]|uniref:Uncharacterized protein n=1 Tax=Rhizophagus clarus TaxID=94130 RepID=A0A2Z6RNT7_9GLOM|nr:hypothetical protein RclHR1_05800015 [Rhizophagus clarus]
MNFQNSSQIKLDELPIFYTSTFMKKIYQFGRTEFKELIESHDTQIKGFFNIIFQSMNLKGKNLQTQQLLKQKVMMLCYQFAAMCNKQVSGAKTAIGLFLINSGASVTCINALANMRICSIYQTLYNKLETIAVNQSSVQPYIRRHHNKLIIGCIDDYHNLHSTRIPSVTSKDQTSHMATILLNTSEALAVPYYNNDHLPIIDNPNDVDSLIIETALWTTHLTPLTKSYNSIKLLWVNTIKTS